MQRYFSICPIPSPVLRAQHLPIHPARQRCQAARQRSTHDARLPPNNGQRAFPAHGRESAVSGGPSQRLARVLLGTRAAGHAPRRLPAMAGIKQRVPEMPRRSDETHPARTSKNVAVSSHDLPILAGSGRAVTAHGVELRFRRAFGSLSRTRVADWSLVRERVRSDRLAGDPSSVLPDLALPYPHDAPSGVLSELGGPPVTLGVSEHLLGPELRVGSRPRRLAAVLRAPVPEASVDEDRDATRR